MFYQRFRLWQRETRIQDNQAWPAVQCRKKRRKALRGHHMTGGIITEQYNSFFAAMSAKVDNVRCMRQKSVLEILWAHCPFRHEFDVIAKSAGSEFLLYLAKFAIQRKPWCLSRIGCQEENIDVTHRLGFRPKQPACHCHGRRTALI
ncbi:MAG: hypothetical protein MJE77_38875 [Proteobacteria bacterium]|nr:hypothetical protein [Pseudomonadota bacterium]